MKITKNLSLTLTACALGIGSSSAQFTSFDFRATSFGNYRQTVLPGSGETTFFEGGNFGVSLRDGQAIFSPPGCFGTVFFNPFLGCPLGATGLVTFGDLDGDGVVDPGTYFSISNISRAAIIQPFAQAAARLVSAPPSLLPRPLAGFTDNSAIVFFNVRTAAVQQFNITGMNFGRAFTAAERGRFDGETVPGTYIFNFTRLINPFLNQTPPPVALALNIFPTLDGFRRVNNRPQGFRFRNVTYQNGFAVLDPLELNTIEWEGNTVNFIAPGADSLFLSIKPLANPADPLSAVVEFDGQGQFIDDPNSTTVPPEQILNPTFPLFPTFAGPTTTRIILPNPLVQSFIIPPNFLFSGQTGILDLEFVVNRPTSSVISDRSTRRFRLPVIVVTQFTTAIAAMLPPTASSLQRSADFDFDGDGASNFAEWAFGSDPNNASSSPSSASLTLTSTPQSGTSATPAVANATEITPTSTTTTTTSSGTTSSSAAASSSANAADGTTTANTSATPSASSAAGSSTGTSTSASTSGNSLQYTVRKLVNPVPALRYTIEYSTDMQSWQTVTSSDPRFVVTETASNLTVATVGAPTGGGGFFRSRVAPR